MSDLEVRHLRLVVAVAEEGSVTKASHRLHLTQSALSHQLRDIEARLGARLFLRASKRMLLTPAGENLLAAARRLLGELRQVEEEVRQMSSGEAGKIRLSTQCYTCYHWLPLALSKFRLEFPRVAVEIDVAATHKPIEALFKGRIDVAIVSAPMRDKRLSVRPLFQDEMLVVMRPDHPLASRPFIRAADFADVSLITYAMPKEETHLFSRVLIPAGITPREVLPMALTEAIVEMVKAGLGISVLAKWAIAPQLRVKTLAAVPLTSKGLHREWSAVTLKNHSLRDFTRGFIEVLASQSASIFKQLEKCAN
ncbi:MAG TPA: LysR family transcriptional regulator [Blastocatellia bacterium]|jgi:LysR family transcriptional regulator for metE and metH